MKNSTIAIIISFIVLISGTSGYFLAKYLEKPKVIYKDSAPAIKIDSTDKAKDRVIIAIQNHKIDSFKIATKYPKVVFVTKHDSVTSKNIDSTALANCSQAFIQVINAYGKCDSLNAALMNKNTRLYKDIDTCNNRYSEAINDKNVAIASEQIQVKNKRWWQGIAVSVIIITIIKIFMK